MDDPTARRGREDGYLLLELMALAGWSVAVTSEIETDDVVVLAIRDGRELEARGKTVAELAVRLYKESMRR